MNKNNGNGKNNNDKKKKFLFVSNEALIGDVCWQVTKEGHEVKYYVKEADQKDVCDGFVDKIDSWEEYIDWADVIIFDDTGFGSVADKLRKSGKLVIGGSVYTDKLEEDRDFGQSELNSVGVPVLPHWTFTDFDEAVEFVKNNPDRYVLKPSGKAQSDKELMFIGHEEDGKDLILVLDHYKKTWSKKIKVFQLQKHAPGVEVAVGVFFNGKDFIMPINVNFEHKRMFPGEIGPSTGEMGTMMYWSQKNNMFHMTMEKMKEKLIASGYVGYIDINCIVNSKGIWPLEFTVRFGYPTISIQMEGILTPMGEFLYSLASGEDFTFKTKKGFQIGVVIAVPPFPFNDNNAFKRYSEDAVILFKKDDRSGVHIGDVKLIDDDWKMAGVSGYALVITGSGITVQSAREKSYERVSNIMLPNMFWRTDIGVRWNSDSDKLQTWGYLF
ncbi:MAG TPA: phosphoribosylamine--glycine ligase [Candidatus Aenigmarchaeota archaeon]|nr:phosphoribosylamine--glycine ligase [Candidatus Aenigmarchaeota archaeon]